ncbi:MAG: phosphoribosyltransferase [Phycisphaerales bacterium]|nr:phosphoribosyltransferase [Phycisphaerales bacterium]
MSTIRFSDREQAGRQLADLLKHAPLRRPLVLAIPRGGIEVGAPLAEELGAELDVILSRKLRAPTQPELAIGAVSETGELFIDDPLAAATRAGREYLTAERDYQLAEIRRRAGVFRAVRPPAEITGRSVIITDDGIATGSTMIAAIATVRARRPHELIVAVPVAPADRLDAIRPRCDRLVCPLVPAHFFAIGQFYHDFDQVPDDRVIELLQRSLRPAPGPATGDPAL